MPCQKTGAVKKFFSAPGLKQISFIAMLVCFKFVYTAWNIFLIPPAKYNKIVQGWGLNGLG